MIEQKIGIDDYVLADHGNRVMKVLDIVKYEDGKKLFIGSNVESWEDEIELCDKYGNALQLNEKLGRFVSSDYHKGYNDGIKFCKESNND